MGDHVDKQAGRRRCPEELLRYKKERVQKDIEDWISRFPPGKWEDPELISPFVEWPRNSLPFSPLPHASSPSSKTLRRIHRIEDMKATPRNSIDSTKLGHQHHLTTPSALQKVTSSSTIAGNKSQATDPNSDPSSPRKAVHDIQKAHTRLPSTDAKLDQASTMLSTPQKLASTKMADKVDTTPGLELKQLGSNKKRLSKVMHALGHQKNDSAASQSLSHSRNGSTATQERGRPVHKYDFDFHFGPSTGSESPARSQSHGGGHQRHESHVTTFSELIKLGARSPGASPPSSSPSKSPSKKLHKEQKAKRRPTPLNLDDARKYGEMARRQRGSQAVHCPITPADAQYRQVNEDGTSSNYNEDDPFDGAPTVSPLRIVKRSNTGKNVNLLKAYNDWKENDAPKLDSAVPARPNSMTERSGKPETLSDAVYMPPPANPHSNTVSGHRITKSATTNDLRPEALTTPFTPLSAWMVGIDGHTRKVSKNLFGDHGWLQDTAASGKKPEPQKATGFLDGVKNFARGIAEKADLKPSSRSRGRSLPRVQRVRISLDPREQSLLYCELEFILSNALDGYIKTQLNGGRLDPTKLKRVADRWARQGRHRVVGFRYDLDTQLELVALHAAQFRFHGARQASEAAVAGLLAAVRANARAMRVRTLCQPDPAVAKHVLDAQALLQLLGCADSLQIALAEVSQFFKVVVEREKAVRERREARDASVGSLAHGRGDQFTWTVAADVSAADDDQHGSTTVAPEGGDASFEMTSFAN